MSFSEDFDLHRDALLRMVDAGVPVATTAVSLGISVRRAYAMLRACGMGSGSARTVITAERREQVRTVFAWSGSINRAATESGLSHGAARRILVAAGLVDAAAAPRGKPGAKARFLELVGQGWSGTRAAREVGVNRRTGQDWRRGVRKSSNKRTYPDGVVVDSRSGTRYTTNMTAAGGCAISDRHLSLEDRLAIAYGLIVRRTFTEIAAGIGKAKSTVSREVRERSIEGIYLPHQAHQAAARARARPKGSKLVTHAGLRDQVEGGWNASCPRSRSPTGSSRSSPTTRACA